MSRGTLTAHQKLLAVMCIKAFTCIHLRCSKSNSAVIWFSWTKDPHSLSIKMPCIHVEPTIFVSCLQELNRNLWDLMRRRRSNPLRQFVSGLTVLPKWQLLIESIIICTLLVLLILRWFYMYITQEDLFSFVIA